MKGKYAAGTTLSFFSAFEAFGQGTSGGSARGPVSTRQLFMTDTDMSMARVLGWFKEPKRNAEPRTGAPILTYPFTMSLEVTYTYIYI